ncbi:MAG: DNA topoisomerase III, partial [Spirochaetales bacterium]|nr:DNA topoisomerase III [Spirochaetales bacterium]
CQRFSCGYEEMEVKKRVEVAPSEAVPTHASASPVKRVIATATPSSSGKKTIVIRKGAVKAAVAKATPQVKWETVTEVVKPSHFRARDERPNRPERTDRPERKPFHSNDRPRSSYESRESSGGGTFADFIKAAEERKKRDEERRKKR